MRSVDKELNVAGIQVVKEKIWFTIQEFQGICRSSLSLSNVEFIPGSMWACEEDTGGLSIIAASDNIVLLLSDEGDKIIIYDAENNSFSNILIKKQPTNVYFHSFFWWKDDVYLIPARYPAIVHINIKNKAVEYIDSWISDIQYNPSVDKFFFRPQFADEWNGKIYLTSAYFNCIYMLDAKNNSLIRVSGKSGELGLGASCIKEYGNKKILTYPAYKKLVLQSSEKSKTIRLEYEMFPEKSIDFSRIEVFDNIIFCVPYAANRVVCIEETNNMLIDIGGAQFNEPPLYNNAWINEGKVYCQNKEKIDVFSIDGHRIESKRITGNEFFWRQLMEDLCKIKGYVNENEEMQLELFCTI